MVAIPVAASPATFLPVSGSGSPGAWSTITGTRVTVSPSTCASEDPGCGSVAADFAADLAAAFELTGAFAAEGVAAATGPAGAAATPAETAGAGDDACTRSPNTASPDMGWAGPTGPDVTVRPG